MDESLKSLLARGHLGLGLMLFEFHTAGVGPLVRSAGGDFAVFDMEAGPLDFGQLAFIAPAARASGLTVMVRIPTAQAHFASRALDVGADAIMVPMVEDAAAAARMVQAVYYPPEGQRGAAFGIAHDGYGARTPIEAMKLENDRVLLVVQIEGARGVLNAEEIAAVRGVDALWIGHNDLTNSLGIPGQIHHQDFVDAVSRVGRACANNGKALGGVAPDLETGKQMISKGYRLLSYLHDARLLQMALGNAIGALRETAGTPIKRERA